MVNLMVTIKDIAKIAGVSPTTVGNVLHGRTKKVSPETLDKVNKVINDTKYVANMGAKVLTNSGSRIIGVIMNYSRREDINAIKDPFYGEIIGALEKEIREKGYFMMLYTSADVEESLKMASAWNIEGLVVLGCSWEDCVKFKENTTIPVVSIDSYFSGVEEKDMEYINVGLQDFFGAYEMTNYLISEGHRKIAFLADEKYPVGVDKERFEGYKKALRENNIEFHNSYYIPLSYKKNIRHLELKNFGGEKLNEFTALFFASDFYAVDAMNIFQDNNIKVPEDISIVGFDNNIFSEQCRPKLTTVEQKVSEKALYAVKQFMFLIKKEPLEKKNIHLPVKLVIRDSVKNLKGNN